MIPYTVILMNLAGFLLAVLNVVLGYSFTAAAALAADMFVDKIAFKGLTNTSKIVQDLLKLDLQWPV